MLTQTVGSALSCTDPRFLDATLAELMTPQHILRSDPVALDVIAEDLEDERLRNLINTSNDPFLSMIRRQAEDTTTDVLIVFSMYQQGLH